MLLQTKIIIWGDMGRHRNRTPIRSVFSLEDFIKKLEASGASSVFVEQLGERLKGFADEYAEHLKEQIDKQNIGVTGDLKEYLYGRSVMFQDGTAKAGARFNVYGLFVDKGVGKGLMVTERQIGRGLTSSRSGVAKREPKPWLTDGTKKYEVVLGELLQSDGADILEKVIAAELEKGHKKVVVEV